VRRSRPRTSEAHRVDPFVTDRSAWRVPVRDARDGAHARRTASHDLERAAPALIIVEARSALSGLARRPR
jgi:hypothetical protein